MRFGDLLMADLNCALACGLVPMIALFLFYWVDKKMQNEKLKTVSYTHLEVELSTPQIGIGLGLEEYEIYSRFCDKEEFQPILNSMMVFPALVYVFEELKQENGIDSYAGRNWYISLSKARCV